MRHLVLLILSLFYCVSVWHAPMKNSSALALAYSFLLSVAIVPATLLVGVFPTAAGAILPLLLPASNK